MFECVFLWARAYLCSDCWLMVVRRPRSDCVSIVRVCVYAIEWHLPPAHRRVVVNQYANHISCLPNPINSRQEIYCKHDDRTSTTHTHTHKHTPSQHNVKETDSPSARYQRNHRDQIKGKPPIAPFASPLASVVFCVCCVWRIRVPSRVQCSYPYECVTLYRNMHHKQPEYIHAVCVREFLCVCVQHKCISFLRECRLRRAHTTCAWIYGKLNCADAKVCAMRTAISLFVSPLAAVCAGLGLDYIVCMC